MGREQQEQNPLPFQGNSPQGVQNLNYSDTESIRDPNPPQYNQIAPIAVLPGHVQAGQPQILTQPQYVTPSGQIIHPGVLQSNNMLPNAPQVIYVQPSNTQGFMPTPVQQGQQVVYIQNPDVNRVPTICDCESPGYFIWFLIGCFCGPIATFLTSRKLNEGCSAVRHILPFVLVILGLSGVYGMIWFLAMNCDDDRHYHEACPVGALIFFACLAPIAALVIYINSLCLRRKFIEHSNSTEHVCGTCCLMAWCSPCAHGQMGSYTTIRDL